MIVSSSVNNFILMSPADMYGFSLIHVSMSGESLAYLTFVLRFLYGESASFPALSNATHLATLDFPTPYIRATFLKLL